MIKKSKIKTILLNQPLKNDNEDWIGISGYVDKLKEAIEEGANIIAITSDFGSGKSSVISMLKNRYGLLQRIFTKIYSINFWSELDSLDYVGCDVSSDSKNKSLELHKSFLFHLFKQISPEKGSYISKRLSKNYGLFKLQGKSHWHTILIWSSLVFIGMGEVLRRFGAELAKTWLYLDGKTGILEFVMYAVGIGIALGVVTTADFLFSTKQSEGNRAIDENIIIDCYTQEIWYRHFFRKYIFVVEDIDRIDDIDTVVDFLKEIRKYYLTDWNLRGWLHHNRVTFVVNIKPEAVLRGDGYKVEESLYSKFFDYIIDLKRINIDNYDVILNGMLYEIKYYLRELGLITSSDMNDVNMDAIKGMEWIVRGRKIDIRSVKERLNKALTLYEVLKNRFKGKEITFEKCAIATYLTTEYAACFCKINDRTFDELIEIYILDEDKNDYRPEGWYELDESFRTIVETLIKNKKIDTSYRTYFYNYPQGSKLYNVSENIVWDAILYDAKPRDAFEFEKHLDLCSEYVMIEALRKVKNLGLVLPSVCLKYKTLAKIMVEKFPEEIVHVIKELPYKSDEWDKSKAVLEEFFGMDISGVPFSMDVLRPVIQYWNNPSFLEFLPNIRSMLCRIHPDWLDWYKLLFGQGKPVVTIEEMDNIRNLEKIFSVVNYSADDYSLDVFEYIHRKIMDNESVSEQTRRFYEESVRALGIMDCYDAIYEYCVSTGEIWKDLNVLIEESVQSNILEKTQYVKLLESIEKWDSCLSDSIYSIEWYGPLMLEHGKMMYEQGYYLNYVCCMAWEFVNEIDYFDEAIMDTIKNNSLFIYEKCNDVWTNIRFRIIQNSSLVDNYLFMFGNNYPFITSEELEVVADVETAIKAMSKNDLEQKHVEMVAQYFNHRYHNGTETFSILNFVLQLASVTLVRLLFYQLDMDNVRYRGMAANKKQKIFDGLNEELNLTANGLEKMKYMLHIKEPVKELEKDLYKNFVGDKELEQTYVDFVNDLPKCSDETVDNIVHMSTIYSYSEVVCDELYNKGKFTQYVVSKALREGRFVMEYEREETLWETYVDIFVNSNYRNARRYMGNNKEFMKKMIERQEYKDVGDSIIYFAVANQTTELLQEIFIMESIEDQKNYLSKIYGFESKDAAEFFVKMICEDFQLLKSVDIYNNVYEKLVDPALKAKYTKARNQLLTK